MPAGQLTAGSTTGLTDFYLQSAALAASSQTMTVSGSTAIFDCTQVITGGQVELLAWIDDTFVGNNAKVAWCEVTGAADRTIVAEINEITVNSPSSTNRETIDISPTVIGKYYSVGRKMFNEGLPDNIRTNDILLSWS